MGRTAEQPGRKTAPQTIWIYPDAIARVLAFVGSGGVAKFVRDAIDEKLNREGAPHYDPVTMPLKQPDSRKPRKAAPKPS